MMNCKHILFLWLTGLLFLWTSCTEMDVITCPSTGSGYLRIHPDQNTYALPAMRYHFYNRDGLTPVLTRPCDGNGNFEGDLPAGVYRVIAVNTVADKVTFSGMDRYETATVMAAPHSLRNILPDVQLYHQPGKVYAVNLGDFTVADRDTLRFAPLPELLIRRIRIRFLLSGQLQGQLSGITGRISGVYPSVRLFGYTPWIPEGVDIAGSSVRFSAMQEELNWTTMLDVFGLCHPDYGRMYTNTLELVLTLNDGRQASSHVDLTGQLSDIIDQSGGVIPLTLSLELAVDAIGADFSVGILPWDPDGGDDIELY